MRKPLRILNWNINCVVFSRITETNHLIMTYRPDIVILTETSCDRIDRIKSCWPSAKIEVIPPRLAFGQGSDYAGLAVLFRPDLQLSLSHVWRGIGQDGNGDERVLDEGKFQSLTFDVNDDTAFSAVYCRPQVKEGQLAGKLRSLRACKHQWFAIGDLNARQRTWCHNTNDRGKAVTDFIIGHQDFKVTAPQIPSFHDKGGRGFSNPEFLLSNCKRTAAHVVSEHVNRKDHSAIFFSLETECVVRPGRRRIPKTFLQSPKTIDADYGGIRG